MKYFNARQLEPVFSNVKSHRRLQSMEVLTQCLSYVKHFARVIFACSCSSISGVLLFSVALKSVHAMCGQRAKKSGNIYCSIPVFLCFMYKRVFYPYMVEK